MGWLESNGDRLYEIALDFFYEAGHISKSEAEYINHSPTQFVYFDSVSSIGLSRDQRTLLHFFDNVSRLFTANRCAFFSIQLLTEMRHRSQLAYDIHMMIHPMAGTDGTICMFGFEDEVMLSFMGFGRGSCVLSDWYPMDDDTGELARRLDIINFSLKSGYDYFADMTYFLQRGYYSQDNIGSVYDLLPINFVEKLDNGELGRDDLDIIARDQQMAQERAYGDDYVEYDVSLVVNSAGVAEDLDLMLLDIDDTEEENPFGEEVDEDEEFEDEDEEEESQDEYEFEDYDQEIFHDPELMVKWLRKHSK